MKGKETVHTLDKLKIDYKTADIESMILLFQDNLKSSESIFRQGETQSILDALHKLKGGIKILHLTSLESDISLLQEKISLNGCEYYSNDLLSFIKKTHVLTDSLLFEI